MSGPRIEILTSRDPDNGTDVRIWIDGVEVRNFAEEQVDPGAGHMLSAWLGYQVSVMVNDQYSEGFRAAALGAYCGWDNNEYVEDDGGEIEMFCPQVGCYWSEPDEINDLDVAADTLRLHLATHDPQA